jgi:hypothetical protein
MADYRCYLLDGLGAIRDVEVVAGDNDCGALAEAREVLVRRPGYVGFELWQRGRRVHVEEAARA